MSEQRGPRPGDLVSVEIAGVVEAVLGDGRIVLRLSTGQQLTTEPDVVALLERRSTV